MIYNGISRWSCFGDYTVVQINSIFKNIWNLCLSIERASPFIVKKPREFFLNLWHFDCYTLWINDLKMKSVNNKMQLSLKILASKKLHFQCTLKFASCISICTLPPNIYHTPSTVWSKTTLITGSVEGAGAGQPSCK